MTLTIERLGYQGDGIAAGPVFVKMTLPGEVVEGDIENGRISAPKIITPSPDRVTPPCRHFKTCGGCSLQHASDDFVKKWKSQVVRTALSAHGFDLEINDAITSPARSRRRAVFSGRRTKKGSIVGFHGRASGTIIEIPDCKLLHPGLMAAIPALQELTILGASRKGEISINTTHTENGVDIIVTGGKPLDGNLRITLAGLAEKHRFARLTWDDELLAGRAPALQHFDKIAVVPPAGSFLQATKEGEEALLNAVQRAIGKPSHVLDLFAGCGTFALPFARNAEVHCVESVGAMLQALDQGWRGGTNLKKVTTEVRDLFLRPLMPDELNRYDAVIIDPPRAGANAQFEYLAQSTVAKIAAVSCNPVTFARDAQSLVNAGYNLDWVEVIDQFRWSPHVEMVASFTKL
ncbi:MAG: class I SAM-dependent RNA methyltransferase [Paracoccaceae bacterium]